MKCHPAADDGDITDQDPQLVKIAARVARGLHEQFSGTKRKSCIYLIAPEMLPRDDAQVVTVTEIVETKLRIAG